MPYYITETLLNVHLPYTNKNQSGRISICNREIPKRKDRFKKVIPSLLILMYVYRRLFLTNINVPKNV